VFCVAATIKTKLCVKRKCKFNAFLVFMVFEYISKATSIGIDRKEFIIFTYFENTDILNAKYVHYLSGLI